ncbi:MAG: putative membrane protein [Halioglobus sp.]|jgi:putative membrane protein
MSLLNQQQLDKVAASIRSVESQTDAELVTVLAKQADNYYYIPTLWAAMTALLIPLLLTLTPFWLEGNDLLVAQWVTFIVVASVFRIPAIMMRLVPKRVKHWRASSLARRQFLENNLHHTHGGTGLLIFVSAAEHYVEIIADRGISQYVDDSHWQRIINDFTTQLIMGNADQGFVDCIEQCGKLLTEFVPASREKNELPNHLILI